ncbi:MAG: CbiX/SirB N-terminal domain-containing protein [Opitutales bacterium]
MQRGKDQLGEESPRVFLCDNGSLSLDAIRALRAVAVALERKTSRPIRPVGLLHSDRVESNSLDGEPGPVLLDALGKLLADGERDFLILPFFLGPSLGITEWLPGHLKELRMKWPDLRVRMASCLHRENDDRLARALRERVRETVSGACAERPFVALVDHGTPVREVHLVREGVGQWLRHLMKGEVAEVRTCSMERRPEPAYDFNEPLLQNLLLDETAFPAGEVVVAQLFLAPGRHAGTDGDVAQICREAEEARPGLRTLPTKPLGDHPLVLEMLAERLRECLEVD